MDTNEEDSKQAARDRQVICLVLYCTSFLLSIWVADQFEICLYFPIAAYLLSTVVGFVTYYMSCSSRPPQQDIDAFQPFLHPRQNTRQNSLDSGYTSHYGAINNFNIQRDYSNDERFCQLCTLKEQEKVLKNEFAKLEAQANEAYKIHSSASQFWCDHDAHKSEASKVIHDRFQDASRVWYAADKERRVKRKELQDHQQKIRDLRGEMDAHFWDLV